MSSKGKFQSGVWTIGGEVRLDFNFVKASSQAVVHSNGVSLERRWHNGRNMALKVFDKTPVDTSVPKERTNVFDTLRGREGGNKINFGLVNFDSL